MSELSEFAAGAALLFLTYSSASQNTTISQLSSVCGASVVDVEQASKGEPPFRAGTLSTGAGELLHPGA